MFFTFQYWTLPLWDRLLFKRDIEIPDFLKPELQHHQTSRERLRSRPSRPDRGLREDKETTVRPDDVFLHMSLASQHHHVCHSSFFLLSDSFKIVIRLTRPVLAASPTARLIHTPLAQRLQRRPPTTNCLSYADRKIDHDHREEKDMFRFDNWSHGARINCLLNVIMNTALYNQNIHSIFSTKSNLRTNRLRGCSSQMTVIINLMAVKQCILPRVTTIPCFKCIKKYDFFYA